MQIDLRDLQVIYRDYDTSENPPVCTAKKPLSRLTIHFYEKFAKLTRQEENWGLLDNTSTIGTRKGWQKCLKEHCAELRGHRVYWRKDADPYRVKLLLSARSRNNRSC
jgi:DNA phosphorothioation-associated putative methyltransferase